MLPGRDRGVTGRVALGFLHGTTQNRMTCRTCNTLGALIFPIVEGNPTGRRILAGVVPRVGNRYLRRLLDLGATMSECHATGRSAIYE